MQPELAARLSNIARGNFAQKTAVTAVTPVTGLLVTAKKPRSYSGYSGYRSKTAEPGKDVSKPVTEAATAPLETVQPASDARSASLPSAPVAASLDERRASVALLLDAMAEENERRRDWHKLPVEGWREGRVVIRSALTGETNVILFPQINHRKA